MVHHLWIESKLIDLERNIKERQQNYKKQQAFLNLIQIYHTGQFSVMSEDEIINDILIPST
ncbi:MAG: hypothetical protein V1769_03865 [Thermoplasmatota archaeon]